jgi:hypothetical protein
MYTILLLGLLLDTILTVQSGTSGIGEVKNATHCAFTFKGQRQAGTTLDQMWCQDFQCAIGKPSNYSLKFAGRIFIIKVLNVTFHGCIC